MFGIGFSEIVVILLVMIIFIRPDDLPKTLRALGKIYGKLKSMYDEVMDTKDQIMKEIDEAANLDEPFADSKHAVLTEEKKEVSDN
jgi:sec-independent protein translocase protein TatB